MDSVGQHAAIVASLQLPFPVLSDPDRSLAIEPYGVADPDDLRNLARPAMILVDGEGNEAFRFVSRDYADRLPEHDVLEVVQGLGLGPTSQQAPTPGVPEPGKRAMPLDGLPYYLKGARFAVQALGLRHRELGAEFKADAKAYVAEMDRYIEAVQELRNSLAQD